jgi:hypothetical protein
MTARPVRSVKLKPADPFDLIRWLARSQSDPRKAVAELVQNSIDANARTVRIERRRVRHAPALIIRDDGEGVLPELGREEALATLVTEIGHSRKRGLSPRERHDQVVAGKYGIGLLGFWSVGRRMDIRTRVRGSEVWVLHLVEDQERAEIARDRMPLESADTLTEVIVSELHESALRMVGARRLAEYLAAELRGAILASGVSVEIFDGLARGLGAKRFEVVPRRFTGEPLALPGEIAVAGHAPVRVELYLARGQERPSLEVSCAGTLVADDIGELRNLGLDRPPWVGCGLAGLVDFPDFNVPPGTRRGVAPDAAAEAFVRALDGLAPAVEAELKRLDRERGAAASRQVVQDLRRALKGLRSRLPQYELPTVEGEVEARPAPDAGIVPAGAGIEEGEPAGTAAPGAVPEEEEPSGTRRTLDLFPPGPLHAIRISPPEILLAPGRERRVFAAGVDEAGRRVAGEVELTWSADSPLLSIAGEGRRPAVLASAEARPGSRFTLFADGRQGDRSARGEAAVLIIEAEEPAPGLGFGIPEPELVDDAAATWRSRFDGRRWQVNASHDDYVALHGDPKARLRYLLALLAKEIALRTHGVPGSEAALDSLVEILAHAERNLRGG